MGDRARNWCKHYSGTANEKCRAGVIYTDVAQGRGTTSYSLPCFRPDHKYNPLGATCDKCEFRTEEEAAAMEEEGKQRLERMWIVRKAIVEACGGPWRKGMKTKAGMIPCPVCKSGSVNFSRSGYNGHIHAACSTENCISWME